MSTNLVDVTAVWKFELRIRTLYLESEGVNILNNFSCLSQLA